MRAAGLFSLGILLSLGLYAFLHDPARTAIITVGAAAAAMGCVWAAALLLNRRQ